MSRAEEINAPEAKDPMKHVRFALGLATLRVNGFASIEAKHPRSGWFQTRPLQTSGRRLFINARCRPGGEIRVEGIKASGEVIGGMRAAACDPFTGDAVDQPVTWGGCTDAVEAGWVKLRFFLREAEVFSFRFGAD